MTRRKYVPHDQRFGPWQDHVTYSDGASYTLDRHIDSLRLTDPARWAELNAEWQQEVNND